MSGTYNNNIFNTIIQPNVDFCCETRESPMEFYRKHLLLTLIIIKITETPSEWVSGSVSWSVLVCAVSRDTEPRKMGH